MDPLGGLRCYRPRPDEYPALPVGDQPEVPAWVLLKGVGAGEGAAEVEVCGGDVDALLLACSSVRPQAATSGSEKTTLGTPR